MQLKFEVYHAGGMVIFPICLNRFNLQHEIPISVSELSAF
jgi:hypothetical protein